jgi:hypothetical protein
MISLKPFKTLVAMSMSNDENTNGVWELNFPSAKLRTISVRVRTDLE